MDITIWRERVLNAVKVVSKAADPRNIKPILGDVLLDAAEDGSLRVWATDLELGAEVTVAGQTVEEAGQAAVPVAELLSILRESPDDELALHTVDGKIEIVGGDARYRIACDDPGDMPAPQGVEGKTIKLPAAVLAEDLLAPTRFAAASEAMRYALNAVCLDVIEGDGVVAVGADGRRLAKAEADRAQSDAAYRALLPLKGVGLIVDMLRSVGEAADDDADVQAVVTVGERSATVEADGHLIWTTLVEGHYPNYHDVIPADHPHHAEVPVEALMSAVRRASIVTTEDSHAVNLTLAKGRLAVESESPERGTAAIRINAPAGAPELHARLNPSYLLDACKACGAATLTLRYADGEKPLILEAGQRLFLIMPITQTNE